MRTKLTRLKVLRESKIRAAHVPNLYKLGALKGLDINPIPHSVEPCIEFYVPKGFWRVGWISNKALQKFGRTNPVITMSSGLISVKQ